MPTRVPLRAIAWEDASPSQPRPQVWSGQQGRAPSACPRHFPSINAAEAPIRVLGSGTRC